ncbi:MAG TPA: PfkB family carbohydrate kinase [Vicinamibacterales bacterium]|jgi:sugar/nucleoside kinase (ribokinase family)
MAVIPDSSSRAWDVIGLGANSVDLVHLLPAFPKPSGWHSKMRIARQVVCCGGQTATAMATCAAFGLRARYIGAIGRDDHGRRVRETLGGRGIDLSGLVTRDDATTQFAVILIDGQTGERAVLWDRDERLALEDADVPLEVLASTRLLHVDDVDQAAAIRAARHARELGIPVTSDLDRMTERTEELVRSVTVPIFAEGLTEQLTGIRDSERALRALRHHHDGLLCMTAGDRGAVALDGDRFIVSPACRVDAVDTTGSGDVFRGAFIYGLLAGWETARILQVANAAAAVKCMRLGALDGVPGLAETLRMMEDGHAERRV